MTMEIRIELPADREAVLEVNRDAFGASGTTGRRCGDVTAMARTLPACRNDSSEE